MFSDVLTEWRGQTGTRPVGWGGSVMTQISSSFSRSELLVSEECPACTRTSSSSFRHQRLLGPSLQVRTCSESTHLWTGGAMGADGTLLWALGWGAGGGE